MKYLYLIAISLFVWAASAHAQPEGELIFSLQSKHVHSSTIVECPNGDLLAAWFHGSGERSANDVKIQGARRKAGASTWGRVFTMADTPDFPDCNPVLFIDARDRLWLFWIVAHSNKWERSILRYRRSESYEGEGAPQWKWQDIILLKPGETLTTDLEKGFRGLNPADEMWGEYAPAYSSMVIDASRDPVKRQAGWMTRQNPIVLPSGRILLPLYSDGFNVSLIAYSDDTGDTWHSSKPIVGLGPIQPALARKKDGTIVAYLRDSGVPPGRIMRSTSSDDGVTWTTAPDTGIPNPGSSVAVRVLRGGRWVMVFNNTEHGRHRLALTTSDDEGKTWSDARYLDRDESRKHSFAYPTIIQTRDGRVHISYSYTAPGGASIKHVSLDPKQGL